MKTLKGWITTSILAAILVGSTGTVNAGIIIAGASEPTNDKGCTQKTEPTSEKDLGGIIIAGFGGIIIAGFGGIIIAGAAEETPVDCGIIIAG